MSKLEPMTTERWEQELRKATCAFCAADAPLTDTGAFHVLKSNPAIHVVCNYKPALLPIVQAACAEVQESAQQQELKFTYCAYCGHKESVDVDGDIIAAHIRTCEKHPARQWEAAAYEDGERAALDRVATKFETGGLTWLTNREAEHVAKFVRALPVEAAPATTHICTACGEPTECLRGAPSEAGSK